MHQEKGIRMKVTATIDTRAAVRGEEASQSRELEVDAPTYEEGRDQLIEQVPDGFQILGFAVPDRVNYHR